MGPDLPTTFAGSKLVRYKHTNRKNSRAKSSHATTVFLRYSRIGTLKSSTIFTDADDIRHRKLSELRKFPLRNGSEPELRLWRCANGSTGVILYHSSYHGSSRFKKTDGDRQIEERERRGSELLVRF
ncbi:unnamed protein product [Calypogeia fissa]